MHCTELLGNGNSETAPPGCPKTLVAVLKSQGRAVAEAMRAMQTAKIMVERPVFLNENHHVPDVRDRAGRLVRHARRWQGMIRTVQTPGEIGGISHARGDDAVPRICAGGRTATGLVGPGPTDGECPPAAGEQNRPSQQPCQTRRGPTASKLLSSRLPIYPRQHENQATFDRAEAHWTRINARSVTPRNT